MSKIGVRILASYFSGMGVYGYYRGYNNLFSSTNYNIPKKLLVDKAVDGISGFIYQINPFYQPFIMYGVLRRLEKTYLHNEQLNADDYRY